MKKEEAVKWMQEKPFVFPGSLFKHYKQLGLNDQQFLMLMHLDQLRQEGVRLPSPEQISQRMSAPKQECSKLLHELLSARFIEINEIEVETGQVIEEEISLRPLFEKLYDNKEENAFDAAQDSVKKVEGRLFETFETELARPLTPMEMEMISMWLDEDAHTPELIEAALKEAVISSKLNFRYVDRILHDWKRNGVRTIEAAKKHGEQVRKHHSANTTQVKSPAKPHPGYNWLEGRS